MPIKKEFHSNIYTKTGDKGETSLIGGVRVKKTSQRVKSYGHVDEANAFIGFSVSLLREKKAGFKDIIDILEDIQNDLHIIQAELSNPKNVKLGHSAEIKEEHVAKLEKICDKYDEKLKPLHAFILSGGSARGASLHIARTIARRAEIDILELSEKEQVSPILLKYINRLSDTLFILARAVNSIDKTDEKNPRY